MDYEYLRDLMLVLIFATMLAATATAAEILFDFF